MSRAQVVAISLAIGLLALVLVGAYSSRVTDEVRGEMPGEVAP